MYIIPDITYSMLYVAYAISFATHLIFTLFDGVLAIPPPILSRVYQTLSRGFVNLLNAKKIADTRFPFPYAQTIAGHQAINKQHQVMVGNG